MVLVSGFWLSIIFRENIMALQNFLDYCVRDLSNASDEHQLSTILILPILSS
jgi:hypothetical protein